MVSILKKLLNGSRYFTYCYFGNQLSLIPISFYFILNSNFLFAQNRIFKNLPEKGCFILSLPSTDCITCKANGENIISNILKNGSNDSIIIVTDNDAGEYYIVNKSASIFNNYRILIDTEICNKLSPFGKSSISYYYYDTLKTVSLNSGLDSLNEFISLIKNNKHFLLNPVSSDTIVLKYNVFNFYGNYVIQNSTHNLFLFSNKLNTGCYLLNHNKNDTALLTTTEISNTKYDSLYHEFNCSTFSNVSQNSLREFDQKTGISIAKIYRFAQHNQNYYILYGFLTGKEDTIRRDSISRKLNYNISIATNIYNMNGNPNNLDNYKTVIEINPYLIKGDQYMNVGNFEFCIDNNFICLPVKKIRNITSRNDSAYYLAQFSLNALKDKMPSNIIYYPTGNFYEECILRPSQKGSPILVNKNKKVIDFGEGFQPLEYDTLKLKGVTNDSLDYLYDYYPKSQNNISIIALTKKGSLVYGEIKDKSRVDNIRKLYNNETPIYCQFLEENKWVTIFKKEHKIITNQFSISME